MITFNRLKKGTDPIDEVYLGTLPKTYINYSSPIKCMDVIALGNTDYNKKICEEILDSYIFKDKTVTWQCFDRTFKPINKVAYWRTARYGIHHPDASCSWKCLMMSLNNPEYGLILKITTNDKTRTTIESEADRTVESVCENAE
jgi:pterin-4a-carbinolamine dehydratase